jgi:O-antigen ligase
LDVCLWAALALGLGAIYERLTYRSILPIDWASHELEIITGEPRSQSFLGGAWVLSAVLSMLIPICIYMLPQKDNTRRRKAFLGTVLLASALGLAFAFIRAGWIAVAAGCVTQVLVWRGANRRRLTFVVLIVIGVIAAVLSQSTALESKVLSPGTLLQRQDLASAQIESWLDSPLFGQGVGAMYEQIVGVEGLAATTSHSTYLNILVGLGGIGLVLYLLPQVLCIVWGVKRIGTSRRDTTDKGLVAAGLAMIVAYIVNAAASEAAGFIYANGLLWLGLALLIMPHYSEKAEH